MSIYKFEPNETYTSTLRTHKKQKFFIYDKRVYINDTKDEFAYLGGEISGSYLTIPVSSVNSKFKTISVSDFRSRLSGTDMTSSYPLSSSLSVEYFSSKSGTNKNNKITSLKNTINSYSYRSTEHAFGTKDQQELKLINIPSIFYGSEIKKGTVSLKFYISGTLFGELKDEKSNGDLIQVGPANSVNSGSTAGIVLYSEGVILLTGSWGLSTIHKERYLASAGADDYPKWVYFGTTGSAATATSNVPSSSFSINFSATEKIPTINMIAKTRKGSLNYSTNPTFLKKNQTTSSFSSTQTYAERGDLDSFSVASSSHGLTTNEEKVVYISTIGIYDENKNLIGFAKLSNPVKKALKDSYTFKLKYDV